MPEESQIARWATAIVSVGIFVVGVFAVSLRANLASLDEQFDSMNASRLVFVQEHADDHAQMWRRIGFLEAKLEAFETMTMIDTIEETAAIPPPN